MDLPILKDFVIVFGLSIGVLLFCQWLKVPSIVGFLVTGIISGPYGLGLISTPEQVKLLAEIGIIVLLFTIGLEYSFQKILYRKRYFFIAGPIQVFLTIFGGYLAALFFGRPHTEAVFLGFLLSMSSTAIVMRILQEKGEVNTPHGSFILGILIFQDLIVVPMVLIIPFLAGADSQVGSFTAFLEGLLLLGLTFICAWIIVPYLLLLVARTRSRELFLLTVIVVCFGIAWVASSAGLSLALGAFLGGLIISESEYSQQAIGDIIPLQDIFTSLFFISIGMQLDFQFFFSHFGFIALLTIGIIVLKFLVVWIAALIVRLPLRTAVLSGLSLLQIGEFSFVLATTGIEQGLGSVYLYQIFLAVATLTMGLTPFFIRFSTPIEKQFFKIPFPSSVKTGLSEKEVPKELKSHVVIVGMGFAGINLGRSCEEAGISYIGIELNPDSVKEKENIIYGDASHEQVMRHAGVERASSIAVLVNDPIASLRIVALARKLTPTAYIVVRTRYLEEMRTHFLFGANDVIPDELGTAVEIFSRVLHHHKVPKEKIRHFMDKLRAEGLEVTRPADHELNIFSDIKESVGGLTVRTLKISESSSLAGKTIGESELRKKSGLTVLAIKRDNTAIHSIDAETQLLAGDRVVLIGKTEAFENCEDLFNA